MTNHQKLTSGSSLLFNQFKEEGQDYLREKSLRELLDHLISIDKKLKKTSKKIYTQFLHLPTPQVTFSQFFRLILEQ
jgi:hypothetical protein